MSNSEITIYFEKTKATALRAVLEQEGSSIQQKLQEYLKFLYTQLVPVEQQTAIEALIQVQAEQEQQKSESQKHFAIFHVRENSTDSYFINQHFTSFPAAGYRYRLYARGALSTKPQTLAEAFFGSEKISEEQFHALKKQMPEDYRILALIDFNLDEGTVSACKLGCREIMSYNLHDVSIAAIKAFQGGPRAFRERAALFDAVLVGKEISIDGGNLATPESGAPIMQM